MATPTHLVRPFGGHILTASIEGRVGNGEAVVELATANGALSVYLVKSLNRYKDPTVWIPMESIASVVLGKDFVLHADPANDEYKGLKAKLAVWTNLAHDLDLGIDSKKKISFRLVAYEGESVLGVNALCNKAFIDGSMYALARWKLMEDTHEVTRLQNWLAKEAKPILKWSKLLRDTAAAGVRGSPSQEPKAVLVVRSTQNKRAPADRPKFVPKRPQSVDGGKAVTLRAHTAHYAPCPFRYPPGLMQGSSKDQEQSVVEDLGDSAEEEEDELEGGEEWYSEPTHYGLGWHKLNVSQEPMQWEEDM